MGAGQITTPRAALWTGLHNRHNDTDYTCTLHSQPMFLHGSHIHRPPLLLDKSVDWRGVCEGWPDSSLVNLLADGSGILLIDSLVRRLAEGNRALVSTAAALLLLTSRVPLLADGRGATESAWADCLTAGTAALPLGAAEEALRAEGSGPSLPSDPAAA